MCKIKRVKYLKHLSYCCILARLSLCDHSMLLRTKNQDKTSANLLLMKKARKSETQLEKRSDNTKICINFKFREEDF